MFNEKRIHYLIVAALAASFSSDAVAAPRPEDDLSSEYFSTARASSRGFAACESTDSVCWNQLRHEYTCQLSEAPAQPSSDSYAQNVVSSQKSAFPEQQIDLGNGRRLRLESIRYEDDHFATTLDASHSSRPISVRLDEIARQIGDLDAVEANNGHFQFVANSNQHNLWSYVGQVLHDGNQAPEPVEGLLPLKIELQRTDDRGVQLSVAVDGEAIAKSLS